MNNFSMILILAALFQQSGIQPFPPARSNHPSIKADTAIRLPKAPGPSALADLIEIGFVNRIPIGIVVGDTQGICRTSLQFKSETVDAAQLASEIEISIPEYRTEYQNGVLNVLPSVLPVGAAQLLDLKLTHFLSPPEPHQFIGTDLWKSISAVIAPSMGTNIVQGISLSAETVTAINVKDQTVKSILNTIVDKGNGGIWILDSSKVKELTADTAMPYKVFGYVGNDQSSAINSVCTK